MVKFKMQLRLQEGNLQGCKALDLARRFNLTETTCIYSLGFNHRVELDVDEAFARTWFPDEETYRIMIPYRFLSPADVEMNYLKDYNQYQIRLNEEMTVERAKELVVAVRKSY